VAPTTRMARPSAGRPHLSQGRLLVSGRQGTPRFGRLFQDNRVHVRPVPVSPGVCVASKDLCRLCQRWLDGHGAHEQRRKWRRRWHKWGTWVGERPFHRGMTNPIGGRLPQRGRDHQQRRVITWAEPPWLVESPRKARHHRRWIHHRGRVTLASGACTLGGLHHRGRESSWRRDHQ